MSIPIPILECDDDHHSTRRPGRHANGEHIPPTTPLPIPIPIPASTYTHTPTYTPSTKPKSKTKTKNKGIVKRVFGSFGREHDGVSTTKERTKVKGKVKNSNKNKQEPTTTETANTLDEDHRSRDKDQPTKEPDDERNLVQLWQKNHRERERERQATATTMMMYGEQQWPRQARTGPGPAVAMAVQAAGGASGGNGGKSPSYAHPRQAPRPRPHMKSRPHPHPHNSNSQNSARQPPLALRTRNGSLGRKGSVNYAYPLHSPRNVLPPPQGPPGQPGGLLRRESSDSNSQGDSNLYASDASSNGNNNMMTINVYRSASLAHGHGQGQGQGQGGESGSDSGSGSGSIVGLGISVQETLDRGKTTPTRGRRMSVKDIHHKHRTPARKSKVVHRRRQTRYGRPGGGSGQAPSATSTSTALEPYSEDSEWLDINGPLSTPAWYKWAAEGGSERAAAQSQQQQHQQRSTTTPQTQAPLQIPCPMPGCNNLALPNVGLCSDCRIAPRESMFVSSPKFKSPTRARRRSSRMGTYPIIEFNRVSGPFSPLGSLNNDDEGNNNPGGDMGLARSRFNAKFSPRPDFRLQPPPGRKVTGAAKRDSGRSTGSERSHVGFQLAVPRTPEPTGLQQQPRRYSFVEGNNDEVADADPGSATSAGSWEDSRWADDVPLSARSSGVANSPSPRNSRNNQSWDFGRESVGSKWYSDRLDMYENAGENVADKRDSYTDVLDIIDLYLDMEDDSNVNINDNGNDNSNDNANGNGNGSEDRKPENHPLWKWI